jgi:hypothetical protein
MDAFKTGLVSHHRALLFSLLGKRLTRMVRYSWLPAPEASIEYALAADSLFGRTLGPLALVFESGLVIGAVSEPRKNSVLLWAEQDGHGTSRDGRLDEDADLHAISAADPRFSSSHWARAAGARIASIQLLRRTGQRPPRDALPSEAALRFDLDNGDHFYLAHGLHNDSDEFAVLRDDEIPESVLATLHQVFKLSG